MRRTGWCLGLGLALSACGDGGGPAGDAEQDAGGTPDAAADADTAGADAEPSPAPDGADAGAEADGAGDGDLEEPDGAACEHPCLNEFDQDDKSLCPAPKSDWTCTAGCCIPHFKCANDVDCEAQGFDEGQCTDPRFACRCDEPSGTCFAWLCATNAECGDGQLCAGGACVATPSIPDGLPIRIVTRATVLTTGAASVVKVEAWDPASPDVVAAAEVAWSSDAEDVVSVAADGTATGGSKSGTAAITATTAGGETASIDIRNVVPAEGAVLTVVAVEEGDLAPMPGSFALVGSESGDVLATGPIPEDGVISYSGDATGGVDVHLFGETTDWVSWLGASAGVLFLPAPRSFWGEISLDPDANVVEAETALVGANILRGTADFGAYPKLGELELTLSSFPFSTGLFDFNLQAIIGANVKRYFDQEASIPGVDEDSTAEIPGGITFGLDGPAIPEFVLAAPKGRNRVWTLGGRITSDEIAPYVGKLFEAFGGDQGLDFGFLVSALVPLFADFWTTLDTTGEIAGDGEPTVSELHPALRIPLGLSTSVTVPDLPGFGGGLWADSLFSIGGALTADGLFVPLGMTAGSDTADAKKFPPDGVVDGDPSTPERESLPLPLAPLHTGLGGPHTSFGLATVAVALVQKKDDPRREAGSAILTRAAPGEPPPKDPALPSFLGFALGSTWNAETRALSVVPVDGADAHRVLFKGKTGRNWTIWLHGKTSWTVPVPADLLGVEPAGIADRTEDPQLLLVNAFDLAPGIDPEDLGAPGPHTLDLLLQVVDRASFLDVK